MTLKMVIAVMRAKLCEVDIRSSAMRMSVRMLMCENVHIHIYMGVLLVFVCTCMQVWFMASLTSVHTYIGFDDQYTPKRSLYTQKTIITSHI